MRRIRILTCCVAAAIGLCGNAIIREMRPLQPVEADSVVLYDFFWCNVQREADSMACESVRAWPWQPQPITTDKLDRRVDAWKSSLEQMRLTGVPCDSLKKGEELFPMLKETVELGMLTREARFFDVAERMLYNSVMRFWRFHVGWKEKNETLIQLMRSVGSVAYASCGNDIYINMLMRSNVHVKNEAVDFCMQILNSSPWYNDTSIRIVKDMSPIEAVADTALSEFQRLIVHEESTDSVDLTFHIRIPSWTSGSDMLPGHTAQCKKQPVIIMVNGSLYTPEMVDGYAVVKGRWAVGDLISIKMPTPILRITEPNHPDMVALQRGPIVYFTHFDYKKANAHLNLKDPISHFFNDKAQYIALKTTNENKYGKLKGMHFPYYSFGADQIFVPAK